MQTLTENLLSLAREDAPVADVESVSLARAVRDCWQNVQTARATLDVASDRALTADRSRLQQLLENLVRNAVEHGPDDVTVTVGSIDGGFYVEDDGPGIPADARDQAFQSGYTTDDDGTGFGLSIVDSIVDAHGWHVHVTESASGGTRFEFTDGR
jgi:signal transduction histidine kinase